jgi:hypothetical protein
MPVSRSASANGNLALIGARFNSEPTGALAHRDVVRPPPDKRRLILDLDVDSLLEHLGRHRPEVGRLPVGRLELPDVEVLAGGGRLTEIRRFALFGKPIRYRLLRDADSVRDITLRGAVQPQVPRARLLRVLLGLAGILGPRLNGSL